MSEQKEKNKLNKPWFLVLVGATISITVLVIAAGASWILHNYTRDLLIDNLRERLLSISITQASNISAEDLDKLQKESDWSKPEWRKVVNQLRKTKEENSDIVFMYIFRKTAEDSSQMEFVADAGSINPYANLDNNPKNDVDANGDGLIDPEGADKLQWPGQPYPEAVEIPEAFMAYDSALTAEELYEDSYGQVLTGYSPIKDKEGNVVAVLATDIKADDFLKITKQISTPFGVFVSFLVVIIIILATVLIYMLQKELRAKNRISKLAANLKKANDKLEMLDEQKTEFVSLASHQLRGPLTAINGYIDLIRDGDYGEISKEVKETLGKVQHATDDLVQIVGDYLDVSRIELGKMKYTYEDFSFRDMVEEVSQEMTPVLDKANLKLEVELSDEDLIVYADRNKLKQVALNLVDNSIKYSEKGVIKIIANGNPKKAVFSVKDQGKGIEPGQVDNIFAKFVRAPGSNKFNAAGTGLGLFIAKEIIGNHKGKIWAESEGLGKGSTFSFEVPTKKD